MLLLFSCNKNEQVFVEESFNHQIIRATVDGSLDTKTTYNKVGSTYEFSWVADDLISVLLIDASNNRDRFEYKTTETGASATFTPRSTLGAKWSPAEYAFYPSNTNGLSYPNNTASPNITLGGSDYSSAIVITQSNPFMAIPMIGVNQGDGTFKFKAATGILKVTFTNLPTAITGQDLYLQVVSGVNSGTTPLSGTCTFPADDCTLAITSNTSHEKWMKCNITDPTEVVFYVPIPKSTLAANDVKFTLWNGTLGWFLDYFTNPKAIEVERGVVTELPAIDYEAISNSLSLSGQYGNTKLLLTKGPRVAKVQYGLGTTSAEAEANLSSSPTTLTENGLHSMAGLSSSGTYYVAYKLLNKSDKAIHSGVLPAFNYLSSVVSDVCGVYKINNSDSYKLTLSISTDTSKGNIMISHYENATYDKDMETFGTYNNLTGTIVFSSVTSVNTTNATFAFGEYFHNDENISFTFDTSDLKKLLYNGTYLELFEYTGEAWEHKNHYFTNPYIYRND